MNRQEMLKLLDCERIGYICKEQPPENESGAALSYLLRDEQKSHYYLVTTDASGRCDLKAMRHILGTGPLFFASERDLKKILKLSKGNISVFGILNDEEHRCETVIDIRFQNRLIGIHPMDNTVTVRLLTKDLVRLLEKHGHTVRYADLRQLL